MNKSKPMISRVINIVSRLTINLLGVKFLFIVSLDNEFGEDKDKRVYIQITYSAPCTKTGEVQNWSGRKYYLSQYMTDDEIIKTAYVAFESAVKHEVMENFKVDGIILFNPHINFEELLKISHKEICRQEALLKRD